MSGFDNLLYSDNDSNDAIDHIPKTPGPVTVHERESEEEADDSNEDEDRQENADHDSDHEASDSDKSDEVNVNRKNDSDNDSEVERSDAENENEAHDSDEHSDDGNASVASAKEEVNHNEHEESKSANEESNEESGNEDNEEEMEVQSNKSSTPKHKVSDESDEDSDVPRSQPKRLKIDSDDDASNDASKNETSTKAIFGDLSSEDEENEQPQKAKDDSNESHSEGNEDDTMRNDSARVDSEMHENEVFYENEEEQPEPQIEETRIDVEIPRIVASLGQELYFVKLPNFLSVDTHPYDPSWYDEEGLDDEEGGFDDEGRARVKLKVENTMRWRNSVDNDGNIKRESNSRIVRWSDGSMSLHLGSEIFDIYKQQLMPGDNNHLFIRQGTGLQGQAVFKTKLTFRPHSTDSFTHRKMTLSLADRSQKTQKIRVLPTVGKDPEAHRSEMIKKEEDRLKASIRRENKMRRVRDRANIRGPTASYLEPDQYEDEDDEGAISLSAIKNKYKKGGPAYNVYTDSEGSDDDSDLDILDKKRNKSEKKPAKIVEESDED